MTPQMSVVTLICAVATLLLSIPTYGESEPLPTLDLDSIPFPVPPTVTPLCKDEHQDCPLWSKFPWYFCEPSSKYIKFMMQYCRLSCGICHMAVPPAITEEPEVVVTVPVDPCEGIYCDAIACTEDQVWSQSEGSCCGTCVTSPNQGCAPVYKPVTMSDIEYPEAEICRTLKPMTTSTCMGVCASSSMLYDGQTAESCSCCKPDSFRTATVKIECWQPETPQNPIPASFTAMYEYEVIDTCKCGSCDSAMVEAQPPPPEYIMENYYDVNEVVHNFNSKREPKPEPIYHEEVL